MTVTNYLWDPIEDTIVGEYDDNGNSTAEYTTDPDGNLISEERGGETYFYHFDGMGNVTEITDDAGNVVATRRYAAFGETIESSGSIDSPFQFGGRMGYYRDQQTGDYYIRARMYARLLGRWLSVDKIKILAIVRSDSRQRYVYADNNPLKIIDKMGLSAFLQAWAGLLPKELGNKKSTATLDCPAYGCTGGPCTFELSFEPKGQPNGTLAAGTKICFSQRPGEYDPARIKPPRNRPDLCQSEINRNVTKRDHITITLLDGTECRFTEDVFPPNESWPPIPGRMPPACEQIMTIEGGPPRGEPSRNACFVTQKDVRSISIRFTMDISCFCETCRGFGENRDTNEISASAP